MQETVYQRLARHLDDLPGGYPATESGVELRILRRLFTPDEAELAMRLTLLPEEARVVARRAKMASPEAAEQLEAMAGKGLILRFEKKNGSLEYSAAQFVVGIWEYQVERLDDELVRDMNEYIPTLFDLDAWKKTPQMRTIPVGRSLTPRYEVMPYERAEELVRGQTEFGVRPCICRREHRMKGDGCDKPEESCLMFGKAAEYDRRNGVGRSIDREEMLDLLRRAGEAGLVLQPNNAKDVVWICCCCGCCCQVLKSFKRHPKPASLVLSPFVAALDVEPCRGCKICVDRCQMEALRMEDGRAELDTDRCIGCGLCVSTCPAKCLTLARKPAGQQGKVPKDIVQSSLQQGRARGKLGTGGLVKMVVKSQVDRLLARK